MTATEAPTRSTPSGNSSHIRLSFAGIVKSEWIKFYAVRSTPIILLVTVIVTVGMSALMAVGMRASASNADVDMSMETDPGMAGLEPGMMSVTFSYGVAQIVIAILGVLAITSEYSTGRIRSTVTAVPKRTPMYLAKIVVLSVTAVVTAAVTILLSFGVVTAILSSVDMAPNLSEDGAWRSLIGVPLYLTVIALFAMALGTLIRSTPGSIAAVLGIILVLPIISTVPVEWIQTAAEFLPAAAGERLFTSSLMDATLGPWQGFGVLCLWSVVLLGLGGVILKRRDA